MVDGVSTVLAAVPILLILVLMLGLGWSAARAGLVGLATALGIALFGFGFGTTVYPAAGPGRAVGGAVAEAVFTGAAILWIVFPALCIYQLQVRTGAIEVLQSAIGRVSADPRILAILVAWFFALFLEGAAGFGTPVALAAPFLVSAGFGRVQAVAAVLMGHVVGVSFGAVGTPVMPQVAVTGIPGYQIARATGLFHLVLGWVMLLFLVRLVRRGADGRRLRARLRPGWVVAAALCFLGPFYALAYWVGPELPTLGGALFGGAAFVLALRLFARSGAAAGEPGEPGPARPALLRAAAPYLALVGLILASRLVVPLRESLLAIRWDWTLWEAFHGSLSPLYHPGTMLLGGFLLGAAAQAAPPRQVGAAMLAALRQLAAVTVALTAMLALSRLLVHAGMIDTLAAAAAAGLGGAWPVFGPLVGALGTFITGSATTSNVLFTDFQRATAAELDVPVLTMVGAQGMGAAIGNIVCPHNIIAGGATVGLAGREGEVLRRTLLPCVVYALLGGLLALLLIRIA